MFWRQVFEFLSTAGGGGFHVLEAGDEALVGVLEG
jgi:hypothetical protein